MMTHPRLRARVWMACAVLLALLISINAIGISVTAQDVAPQTSTPRPSPTGNGGNATWTISEMTFTSEYPTGGTFTLAATSSVGKITSASLVYQHNPSSRARGRVTFDDASGKWIAKGVDPDTPQWVAVDYWWTLTDETGNTYQTDIQHDLYTDTRREWNHAESEDVEVFWEKQLPSDMGDAIIQAMKDRRQWYYDNWGELLTYRPRAIIFDGESDTAINEWRPSSTIRTPGVFGGVSTVLGGFTTQRFGAFVGIYRPTRENATEFAYEIVLHEVGHLYQFQNGGAWGSELWFQEGDADFNASYADRSGDALKRAKQLAVDGTLPPLADIGGTGLDAYYVGSTFFRWATDRFGTGLHLKLAQLLGRGVRMRPAWEQATGEAFPQLEVEFREWLGAPNPQVPTSPPEPTLLMFPSPTFAPTKTPKP